MNIGELSSRLRALCIEYGSDVPVMYTTNILGVRIVDLKDNYLDITNSGNGVELWIGDWGQEFDIEFPVTGGS